MEAEWHVLTLLKTHVRTSHVSCLTRTFGGVCVCVCLCVCVCGGGGCLEAVAQYPANM